MADPMPRGHGIAEIRRPNLVGSGGSTLNLGCDHAVELGGSK
jgi:hypothetical protein